MPRAAGVPPPGTMVRLPGAQRTNGPGSADRSHIRCAGRVTDERHKVQVRSSTPKDRVTRSHKLFIYKFFSDLVESSSAMVLKDVDLDSLELKIETSLQKFEYYKMQG